MKKPFLVLLGIGFSILAVVGVERDGRQNSPPSISMRGEPNLPKSWYFAEGITKDNFETWLLIQNPNASTVDVSVTYLLPGGQMSKAYSVPSLSQTRIDCASTVPNNAGYGIKVEGQSPIIVERPKYFNYRSGGSSAIGTPSPSRTWYFPNGSTMLCPTDGTYSTTYTLRNTTNSQAAVQIAIYGTDGYVTHQSQAVPPNSYGKFFTTTTPGMNKEFSASISSDQPIIAERPMYFNDKGDGFNSGSDMPGATAPSNTWYLAEGSTKDGFETWIVIQNPSDNTANVRVTYVTSAGPVSDYQQVQVPANSRQTINPKAVLTQPTDFSTQVTSTNNVPIVAERAMYWDSRKSYHSTIGVTKPATDWYLAEGSTKGSFETYILVQNPNSAATNVTLNYLTPTGPVSGSQQVQVPANSRLTVNPLEFLNDSLDFSTQIFSSKPIVVERAMYWSKPAGGEVRNANLPFVGGSSTAPTIKAGHCTPGFSPINISVVSPNGGETWAGGSSHNITWTSTGSIGNVKIESSTNGGTSYSVVKDSTSNTGTYAWTVPDVASASGRVRVSEPGNPNLYDVSDAVFTITGTTPPAIGLSRNALNFGAVAGGVATKAQSVIVSNTGGGALNWTASSDKSWLSASPGSGTGTTVVQASVNAAGLAAGTQTGKITVSDPNALNSPQDITVTLTVLAVGMGAAPFGDFATPLDGTTGITGAIPVTGWVLDDIEVTQVEVKRDPHASDPIGAIGPDGLVFIGYGIFVEGARPDVETGYPGFPLNYRAGWGYMLLTNFLPVQGNGTFKIHAYARDKEGNRALLGSKTITCANATAVKPFGTIDTPVQGGDASGNPFVVFGWVLTPLTKTVPKDGSTIDVYMDSVKVGNLVTAPNVYNQYRVDVATAFPGLNNTGGPVGAFYLDTTKYPNGVHTIFWIATDDAGAADGIGSRYFNIVNTGATASAAGDTYVGDMYLRDTSSIRVPKVYVPKLADILDLPLSFDPIPVRRGFDMTAPPEMIVPDNYGSIHIAMKEVERIELACGKGTAYRGYLAVRGELRPLPIGSTLDARTGRFSWLPGPGFLGTYDLVFVRETGLGISTRIPVRVTVRPKFKA